MNKPLAIKRLGRTNGQQYVGLIVALLAALLLRAALASLPRVIRWDEPDYLWLGKSLVTGHGYTINGVPELHYTPLFPVLVGGIYRLVGDLEIASAFWYVLLGALTVVPVFFLARRIYNPRVALLAALFVAVFPALSSAVLYWGTMTEPLFIFLVYSALWAAVVALEEDRLWAYAASGALFSLAYLARPEGIMWLAAFGVLFVLIWAVRRQLLRRRTLARLGFYLVAFMLVAAPYAIYMVQHTGKLMATGKLSITYDIGEAVLENNPALYDKVTASLDPESGEILWWSERRFTRSMLDIVASDPVQFLTRIWRNAHEMRVNVFSALIFPCSCSPRSPWAGSNAPGVAAG